MRDRAPSRIRNSSGDRETGRSLEKRVHARLYSDHLVVETLDGFDARRHLLPHLVLELEGLDDANSLCRLAHCRDDLDHRIHFTAGDLLHAPA